MTNHARHDRVLTVEEYLALEETSPVRHEYVAGAVRAMNGGTIRHSRVAGNVFAHLLPAAGDGPCQVVFSDVKVRAADDRIYYPDVAGVCVPAGQGLAVIDAPCLVVEVTSPSTRRTDRGEKLDAYRRIASLQTYLVVEQGARVVERHWRDETGAWRHERVTDGAIPIPCPATTLPLDAIYRGIELDPVDDAPRSRPRRVREPAAADA